MGGPGSTVYLAHDLGEVLQLSLNLFPHLRKQLSGPIIRVSIEIQWGSFSHKMVFLKKTKTKTSFPSIHCCTSKVKTTGAVSQLLIKFITELN